MISARYDVVAGRDSIVHTRSSGCERESLGRTCAGAASEPPVEAAPRARSSAAVPRIDVDGVVDAINSSRKLTLPRLTPNRLLALVIGLSLGPVLARLL